VGNLAYNQNLDFIACHLYIMVKLRLKRLGKKREASYRIVAAHSTSRRDGRPLEELGFYNPRTDETRLDVPAIIKRLQTGAQPTETVRHILEKANIFEQLKTAN
jgi:small subunit ribosomal protein S16